MNVHELSNSNMDRSVAKSQGFVREFYSAWRMTTLWQMADWNVA